jgi:hypothetical protein
VVGLLIFFAAYLTPFVQWCAAVGGDGTGLAVLFIAFGIGMAFIGTIAVLVILLPL